MRMMNLRIKIGYIICRIGRKICGSYWVCTNCGKIKYNEEEVMCWECGKGEMIYQGKL